MKSCEKCIYIERDIDKSPCRNCVRFDKHQTSKGEMIWGWLFVVVVWAVLAAVILIFA